MFGVQNRSFTPIASVIRRKTVCSECYAKHILGSLAVEISRPLISSLENVKLSLPGTVLPFSVVCMLYKYIFLQKKRGIAQ